VDYTSGLGNYRLLFPGRTELLKVCFPRLLRELNDHDREARSFRQRPRGGFCEEAIMSQETGEARCYSGGN
jgi:hypothetical protein